ncbi:MAG: hypothetical protein V3T72_02360, partial [Thermoanaerobaculia bacterium]
MRHVGSIARKDLPNAQTPTAVAVGARSENGEVDEEAGRKFLAATELRGGRFGMRSGTLATRVNDLKYAGGGPYPTKPAS